MTLTNGYQKFIGATMIPTKLHAGACPKCNTGTLLEDHDEREFACLNCAFRLTFDKRFDVGRKLCHGSGLSIVNGTESESGNHGRCSGCGRVVQLLVGRNITIQHPPKLGGGDRRPTPSGKVKTYGVRN